MQGQSDVLGYCQRAAKGQFIECAAPFNGIGGVGRSWQERLSLWTRPPDGVPAFIGEDTQTEKQDQEDGSLNLSRESKRVALKDVPYAPALDRISSLFGVQMCYEAMPTGTITHDSDSFDIFDSLLVVLRSANCALDLRSAGPPGGLKYRISKSDVMFPGYVGWVHEGGVLVTGEVRTRVAGSSGEVPVLILRGYLSPGAYLEKLSLSNIVITSVLGKPGRLTQVVGGGTLERRSGTFSSQYLGAIDLLPAEVRSKECEFSADLLVSVPIQVAKVGSRLPSGVGGEVLGCKVSVIVDDKNAARFRGMFGGEGYGRVFVRGRLEGGDEGYSVQFSVLGGADRRWLGDLLPARVRAGATLWYSSELNISVNAPVEVQVWKTLKVSEYTSRILFKLRFP